MSPEEKLSDFEIALAVSEFDFHANNFAKLYSLKTAFGKAANG